MAKTKATPKTLALLRSWGWYYWPVERFNGFSGKKTDLFHIIDYLVISRFCTIGIQSCSGDFSEHMRKLCYYEQLNTIEWLSCPDRLLMLIGWRKVKRKRGMKQEIYKPRVAWIYMVGNKLIFEEKDTTFYGQ